VLQVVIDCLDQVGHIGAQDVKLLDGALLRHIGARQQFEEPVLALVHSAHAHKLVEYGARWHVPAVALDELRKAQFAVGGERTRFTIRVEKVGVTHPARENSRGAVVAFAGLWCVLKWL